MTTNHDDSLPTIATAILALEQGRDKLRPYLNELVTAITTGEADELVFNERLKTVASAMDHIYHSIKCLKTVHPNSEARRHSFYYYMLQDGSGQVVLTGRGKPVSLNMPTHSSWPQGLNTAYAILRHQKDDDYAMLWTPSFHDQVISKLPPRTWILQHQEVNDWINIHDWLDPAPPGPTSSGQ